MTDATLNRAAALSGEGRLLVIAHRGAPLERPENTVSSFGRALEICPEAMLELDVWMSADGAAVVSHDGGLARTCGENIPIASLTLEDLKRYEAGSALRVEGRPGLPFRGAGARFATLDEVLRTFPGARLSVDVKHHDCSFARQVVRAVRAHDAFGRVVFGSFCGPLVARLRADNPGIQTFFTRKEILRLKFTGRASGAGTHVSAPEFTGSDGDRGLRLVTRRFIRAAHRAGIPVYAWTVNRRDRMEGLIGMGIDGIVTDDTALLVEVMADRNLRPA